jgi:hypothetical protein
MAETITETISVTESGTAEHAYVIDFSWFFSVGDNCFSALSRSGSGDERQAIGSNREQSTGER